MRHSALAAIAAVTVVTACSVAKEAGERAESLAAEAARHRGLASAQLRGGVVEVEEPFYGGRSGTRVRTGAARGLDHGEPLPGELEEDLGIDILATAAPLGTIQEIIAGATDLDVVVRTTYPTAEGVIQVPASGTMSVEHRGPLSQLLDRIAARFDLGWSFDGTAIRFDRMVSGTYNVPLPPTAGELSTDLSGVKTGAASVATSKSVTVDPWSEIEAALAQAVAPPATTTLARNTGQITVWGPPSVQRSAARVIDHFAEIYGQRIGLEIATYFLDADADEDFALGVFLQGAFGDGAVQLGRGVLAGETSGSVAILRGEATGSTINFRALASDKSVVDYRLSNTVGQNGVVAPVSLLTTQNYVKETTSEEKDGATKLTVEVDTIDTGLSIFALPRIVAGGEVQLSLWLLHASLNSLDTFGTVQLPKTDHRAIEYTVILAPGETLVIGGYEQETVRKERSGTGIATFFGLGGTAEAELIRTSMVVMVRPTILGG